MAAKAVCFREALEPSFREYAQAVIDNAQVLAETLMAGGIVLASGGTDNHLMLADVTAIGLTGKISEQALDRAGITVNMNMIPFDERKPMDPSGIRLGTPALTTRKSSAVARPSSSTTPWRASASRMRSASAKSRFFRAAARAAI